VSRASPGQPAWTDAKDRRFARGDRPRLYAVAMPVPAAARSLRWSGTARVATPPLVVQGVHELVVLLVGHVANTCAGRVVAWAPSWLG
jgi:hypothetical protein